MTTVRVPFHRPYLDEEEVAAASAVIRSGWLTTGPQCAAFEAELAAYVGARHAVAVSSGTAALHLALAACGVARGDLVLVPTYTFAATAEVVCYFDAVPVFVDCEPESLSLDVAAARRTLAALAAGVPTAGLQPPYGVVRALVPMHYAGQAGDVDGIRALSREFGVAVVEDAAHALPADFADGSGGWRRVGSAASADASCFSFHPSKPVTSGEGGMVTTDDEDLARRVRLLSWHGIAKDAWRRAQSDKPWAYEITAVGYKYNLTDIAAAIGRVQLRKADRALAARQRIAAAYGRLLGDLEALELPRELPGRRHPFYLYTIRLRPDRARVDRDTFIAELTARGIGASVAWRPLHMHPWYRERYGYAPRDFPVAAREWERVVCLPIFPGMSEDDVAAVVAAVRAIV